jgi:hypothetical protein
MFHLKLEAVLLELVTNWWSVYNFSTLQQQFQHHDYLDQVPMVQLYEYLSA